MCMSSIHVVNGQCDITFNNGGAGNQTIDNFKIGNSFTACQDGILSKVKFLSSDTKAGLVLDIYQGEGLSGTKLQTITGISTHTNNSITDYSDIDISSYNISVTNGNVYTFFFSTTDVAGVFKIGNMTAGGQMYYGTGVISTEEDYDLYFEIEIETAAANVPISNWGILIFGLLSILTIFVLYKRRLTSKT